MDAVIERRRQKLLAMADEQFEKSLAKYPDAKIVCVAVSRKDCLAALCGKPAKMRVYVQD